MAKNEELFNAIIKGKRNDVENIINTEIEKGTNPAELLDDSMIVAMREIGDRFSKNEVYVPEMLIAARAMQTGLDIIEPLLVDANRKALAKVCIGTVKGDLHDIGKNLVVCMMKGAGYEVVDLGVNCESAKYKDAVENQGCTVVLLSALLTTTMPGMKDIVNELNGTGAKVVIGGAPITNDFAQEIGADGYASDANEAVKVVDKLIA